MLNHSKMFRLSRMFSVELRKWYEVKRVVPTDPNEPFVLAHYIFADTLDVEVQDLEVVISTKRLLTIAKISRMVQVRLREPIIIVFSFDRAFLRRINFNERPYRRKNEVVCFNLSHS
jgi:hypothetical protein